MLSLPLITVFRGLGISLGAIFLLVPILVSCWMIPKLRQRNTDEKSKDVSIHLRPQEGRCDHTQSLQTNQELSRILP